MLHRGNRILPFPMSAFWLIARRMMRHGWLLAGSFLLILASSLSLGFGMLGAKPVMDAILGEAKGLDDLARELNIQLASTSQIPRFIVDMLHVPESVISQLPTGPFTALVWIMISLASLTIFGTLATFLQGYAAQTVVNRTVTSIRQEAFEAALRTPLRGLSTMSPADVISRVVNDSMVLANGLSILLSKALLQIAKGIAGLSVALAYNWRVTLIALAVTPVLYQVIRKLGKKIKRASHATLRSQSGLYAVAAEGLTSHRVVKVHAAERFEAGRFRTQNREMLRELNRLRTARALASPLTEMLSVLMLCGMVVVLGGFIINKEISPAGFVLAIASLAVAGASLKPLTSLINDIQSSAPAAERILTVLQLTCEPGQAALRQRLPKLPRHATDIVFDNVTVTHPGNETPAIRDVTLRIRHGARVAIVGGNGSGKSTLLSLLPRLYDPDSGRVLIDGTDIKSVNIRSLREQIGVVTQEVTLFKGTIRSNIVYGLSRHVTDDEIVSACKRAHAHDFIAALSAGYDTNVSEQGSNFSGGQRQRISIARAILRDPSILIMDEATSMIDAESEVNIAEAVAEFGAGRTCLIVAHRQATIQSCDHVVVMEAGRIIDQGAHDELLARCEAYRVIRGAH